MTDDPNIPPEQHIDQEFIERLITHDKRFRDIDFATKVENELRDSLSLRLVLEAINEQAADALEKLVFADASDLALITRLQADVRRAKIMASTLDAVRRNGAIAERIVLDENMQLSDVGGNQNG